MPTALLVVVLLLLLVAGAAALGLAWREHDRLIRLAWRAERGPAAERAAARAALDRRVSRPWVRPLARWMGLVRR